MLRALYLSGGALVRQAHALDTAAHNIANLNTHGFKADRAHFSAFPQVLLGRTNELNAGTLGQFQQRAPDINTAYTDWREGVLESTGNTLDVAIRGPGFFIVEEPDGSRSYTRNGAFTVNGQRELVTQEGLRVLSPGGQPVLIPGDGPIVIGSDGNVQVNGVPAGQLGIVNFTDLTALEKLGTHRWRDPGAAGAVPAAGNTLVEQGRLERSNVPVVTAITELTTILRSFEAGQKVVSLVDDTLRQAAANLGRASG